MLYIWYRGACWAHPVCCRARSEPNPGFKVQGPGFGVQGSGFRVQGSGFRVQGYRETGRVGAVDADSDEGWEEGGRVAADAAGGWRLRDVPGAFR